MGQIRLILDISTWSANASSCISIGDYQNEVVDYYNEEVDYHNEEVDYYNEITRRRSMETATKVVLQILNFKKEERYTIDVPVKGTHSASFNLKFIPSEFRQDSLSLCPNY